MYSIMHHFMNALFSFLSSFPFLTPYYHYSRLDGIVLSPQGRSFARGCQVNVEKQDGGEGRNKLSGRLGRGWDGREKGRGRGRVIFHFYELYLTSRVTYSFLLRREDCVEILYFLCTDRNLRLLLQNVQRCKHTKNLLHRNCF